MVAELGSHKALYEGSMLSFDEWADYVENVWSNTLRKSMGVDGAQAAITTTRPMFAMAAQEAYYEYVAGWRRHQRRKAVSSVRKHTYV